MIYICLKCESESDKSDNCPNCGWDCQLMEKDLYEAKKLIDDVFKDK